MPWVTRQVRSRHGRLRRRMRRWTLDHSETITAFAIGFGVSVTALIIVRLLPI